MKIDHQRHIGDTRTVLSVTIEQRGTSGTMQPVDLTGKTVEFKMVNAATGASKIDKTSTGVSVETAVSGTAYYRFSSSGVDTAGIYHGWFVVTDTARTDHFPVGQGVVIGIDSDTQTAEEAYRSQLA